MPSYDGVSFDPAAPVALVTLRSGGTGLEAVEVPMLLDTGADVTLVPRSAAERLGLRSIESVDLVGFDGQRSASPIVELEMRFAGRLFRGRFGVVDGNWGVLGRNVLNALSIHYDGPRLRWDLTPSA